MWGRYPHTPTKNFLERKFLELKELSEKICD